MRSIWAQTCEIPPRAPLPGDLETEIAVVGAGMAGVLISAALQEAGHQVVILEAERIGSGQTGGTTAKITSQHGLCYAALVRSMSLPAAKLYAQSNEAAIQGYRRIILERGIDCGLETCSSYVCGAPGTDPEPLMEEARAAAALGLPAAFTADVPLPFPTAGAVRFKAQAQFHPLQFLKAMSDELTVFEHTRVQAVEDHALFTGHGTVRAERIVFACHFPFVDLPGMYFARMHQERSYVLALAHAPRLEGMFLGSGAGHWSLRSYRDLLLLGGEGHRTGENGDGGRYDRLRERAAAWFPGSREVAHWSAQDCMPPDGVPYIGRYASSRPDWFVATGFQKWGMTASMVAAMVLRELVCGRDHPAASLYSPSRWEAAALPGIAAEGWHAVKGLAKRSLQIPTEAAAHIPPDHGAVVSLHGEKVGVYRDEEGALHPVEIRCPHLGCQLEWDPDTRTWDCPCHGSRFDRFGHLLSGPALEDIVHEDA